MHFGQGKWYPGEQLPRWSLNCYWRKDGEPIWRDDSLIADESKPGEANEQVAARLSAWRRRTPGTGAGFVFPAYEDVFYYLWRERALPANVDPFDARLEDELERKRLARCFRRGSKKSVGNVLPVARDDETGAWRTSSWFLRDERCYLIPGDSPMGYRLPLDSLPWVERDGLSVYFSAGSVGDLGRRCRVVRRSAAVRARKAGEDAAEARARSKRRCIRSSGRGRAPGKHESAAWLARTALCAEPRNGVLYIFMPPWRALEDYLELVAAVEATAESLRQPVLLEGYEPPS